MKKLITLSSVALALLTASCSNDTVLEEKTEALVPIGFNAAVTKTTRATDLTKDNLEKFYVYGYKSQGEYSVIENTIFKGEEVSKSDDGWTYSNKQYWQDDYNYYFHAFSYNNGKSSIIYEDADGAKRAQITVNGVVPSNLQDLIYAYGYSAASETRNTTVGLEFKHLFSRVKFKFVGDNSNPENCEIDISSISIKDALTSGSVEINGGDVDNASWNTGGSETSDLVFGSDINFTANTEYETDSKFMIPAGIAKSYTAKLSATCKAGGGTTLEEYDISNNSLSLPEVDMKSGYSYVYTIKVKLSDKLKEITFDVTEVKGYGDDENQPVDTVL
jgi:hypothetical protein